MCVFKPWKVKLYKDNELTNEIFFRTKLDADYAAHWYNRVCGPDLRAAGGICDIQGAKELEKFALREAIEEIISEKLLTSGR